MQLSTCRKKFIYFKSMKFNDQIMNKSYLIFEISLIYYFKIRSKKKHVIYFLIATQCLPSGPVSNPNVQTQRLEVPGQYAFGTQSFSG